MLFRQVWLYVHRQCSIEADTALAEEPTARTANQQLSHRHTDLLLAGMDARPEAEPSTQQTEGVC